MGLALGMAGMFILIGPAGFTGAGEVNLGGAALLIMAMISWAAGSLYAAKTQTRLSPVLFAGMQMIAGGALLAVVGLLRGELHDFALAAVSLRSLVSLGYLIVFGSLIAFTSYSWLLRVTPAAGFAVQQTIPKYHQVISAYLPSTGYFPLGSAAGFAVLCGYTAVALGLAVVLIRRRDA